MTVQRDELASIFWSGRRESEKEAHHLCFRKVFIAIETENVVYLSTRTSREMPTSVYRFSYQDRITLDGMSD
jgi:ssDNA-specific exonuclease RecJ